MSGYDLLKCRYQRLLVEGTSDRPDDLLEVDAGFPAEQVVEEHSLLGRRELIGIDDPSLAGRILRSVVVVIQSSPQSPSPSCARGMGTPPSLPFQESKPDVCPHKAHLRTRPLERNLSHELRPLEVKSGSPVMAPRHENRGVVRSSTVRAIASGR